MTTISAKSILASQHALDPKVRIDTLLLRYPRCIHAEFMTHRVFSRNAASSRAIPVKKLIEDVLTDPFIPIFWGSNQKGMQAGEECLMDVELHSPEFGLSECYDRETAWLCARDQAVMFAKAFAEAGYHKQAREQASRTHLDFCTKERGRTNSLSDAYSGEVRQDSPCATNVIG
jgi:hypothetical protein